MKALVLLVLFMSSAVAMAVPCDVNGDGKVNAVDLSAIAAARNQKVAPGDPRDADGDGVVTMGDYRTCATRCTTPGCR